MALLISLISAPGASAQSHAAEEDTTLGEFLTDTVGATTGFDVAVNGTPTVAMAQTLRNGDTVSLTPRKLASARWTPAIFAYGACA